MLLHQSKFFLSLRGNSIHQTTRFNGVIDTSVDCFFVIRSFMTDKNIGMLDDYKINQGVAYCDTKEYSLSFIHWTIV